MFKLCLVTVLKHDICVDLIFNHNQCCLIKNLTPGNVGWVARQDVYTVTIVTKFFIREWQTIQNQCDDN